MNLQPKQSQSVVRSSATVAVSATGADQSLCPFPIPLPCEDTDVGQSGLYFPIPCEDTNAEQSVVAWPWVPCEDVGA